MAQVNRRAFLGATAGAVAAIAGCQSSPALDTSVDLPTIASTTAPSGQPPLPTPVAGDPEASVTVKVFKDFACPHCSTFANEVFPQIADDYLTSEEIRYEYFDFPIPVDDVASYGAANAARKIQHEAGPQAFFEYEKLLYQNQSELSQSAYSTLAEEFQVDPDAVSTAASQVEYEETVASDKDYGEQQLGVSGTPAVFVNGNPVQFSSEIAYEPVQSAIENSLSE